MAEGHQHPIMERWEGLLYIYRKIYGKGVRAPIDPSLTMTFHRYPFKSSTYRYHNVSHNNGFFVFITNTTRYSRAVGLISILVSEPL